MAISGEADATPIVVEGMQIGRIRQLSIDCQLVIPDPGSDIDACRDYATGVGAILLEGEPDEHGSGSSAALAHAVAHLKAKGAFRLDQRGKANG